MHESGAAGRYATALFELAKEAEALDEAERDMQALGEALEASEDLRRLTTSPLYDRAEQMRAMEAVAGKMGLADLARKTVGLLAARRRLFMLGDVIRIFNQLMAEHRGEVTAEVTAATKLTGAQEKSLAETLKKLVGAKVSVDLKIDPDLLGGLVVKLGSKLFDASLRTKLRRLELAMKGTG